jgi:hypothetical protein
MNVSRRLALACLTLLLGAPVGAGSAAAQTNPELQGPPSPPKIVQNCRKTGKDEIVVCGRPERSPYRLPPPPPGFDPNGDKPSVSRERNGLMDEGAGGIGSCSTVGPGGTSGCMARAWQRDREQSDGHGRRKGLISKVLDRDRPEPIPPSQ